MELCMQFVIYVLLLKKEHGEKGCRWKAMIWSFLFKTGILDTL